MTKLPTAIKRVVSCSADHGASNDNGLIASKQRRKELNDDWET